MKPQRATRAPAASAWLVIAPVVVAAIAVLVSKLVDDWAGVCWNVAWTLSSGSAVAGMLLARRAAPPSDRGRWTLWAGAAAAWVFGQLLWDLYGLIGMPASPNLADAGWWSFAVLVMISLARSRAQSRAVRVVAMFETLPLICGAVALSLAELWHTASLSPLTLAPKVSALLYPALFVAATVLMLQSMIAGSLRGSRSPALRLVLGGMACQALAFGLWSEQLLSQVYVPGNTPLDGVWVVGLAMIGMGGLMAARHPEQTAETNEPSRHGWMLPAALFVVLIAALINNRITHGPSGAAITLAVGLLFSGAALALRGALLESRLHEMLARERQALAALAEREAELARLNTQLVEDSRRDALTGMRNRRALADDLLQLDVSRRQDSGSFAVALCDVDHFKVYNDELGHLAGDQALREVAAIVRGALRPGDVAYRFGGEELLVVLRDVDEDGALAAVERVRTTVQRAAIAHPSGVGGVITVSIGVAAGNEEPSALIARADAALYNAKRSGRNRVVAVRESGDSPADLGRHRPAVDESVPRHVRSMMAVSRAAASGAGPMPVLEALAETIRSELAFHIVAVSLLELEREELRCVIVLGDDDARAQLLGRTRMWGEWDRILRSDYQRCGAIWIPAGEHAWEDESVFWIPPSVAAPGPDSWDPDDLLVLPLRGQDGDVLGIVSVDQPVNGRRPDDSQIAYLMAVADHAALALEQAQRGQAQSAAALEQSAELRLAAVMLLAETLDLRDPGTARHSRTVGDFARRTAIALELDPDRVERIHAAGVLHDLGKLGIADAILYKPGALDDHEWTEMKRHPEIGARILQHAGLKDVSSWVRAHHERIDGRGYPDGLPGEAIALEARILAVADAYEAMIADRPYRAGLGAEAAREELQRCAGSQFDGRVVEAFLAALDAAATETATETAAGEAASPVPGGAPAPQLIEL